MREPSSGPHPQPTPDPTPEQDPQNPADHRELLRYKRLLNKADKNPAIVLEDKRCHDERFCLDFIDRCNQRALDGSKKGLAHSEAAVGLAKKIGRRHLVNLARGALAHALIDLEEYAEAEDLLLGYHSEADECCTVCLGDWLWRMGDMMVEARRCGEALLMIEKAMAARRDDLDADTSGRFLFIRAIAAHLLGADRAALEDVGRALMELDLESPPGYFADSLAFVGVYLERDPGLDERALELLERFRARIKGLTGWQDVRVRYSWVEGVIYGRMGDTRRAIDRLDRVRQALLKSGPARHAVAVTLDLCQIYARAQHEPNLRAVTREISNCLRRLPSKKILGGGWKELSPYLHARLERVLVSLRLRADRALIELVDLRRSFRAVVPGLVGPPLLDRYLGELHGTASEDSRIRSSL